MGPCVPDGYEAVPHQVAGHMHKDGKEGMLRLCGDSSGKILKPIQNPPKGQREVDFYKAVFEQPSPSAALLAFRQWMPRFDGVVDLPNQQSYLRLDDQAAPYKCACVMDIKIGRRTWDNCAAPEKIQAELAKYPLQSTLGYRIGGMRLYSNETDSYTSYSKSHCLSLDEQRVSLALHTFFSECKEDVSTVLAQLHELLALFEQQKEVHFYSSSLLVIRECHTDAQCRALVRMIDFAHAYILPEEEACVDDNYLFGLRNLITALSSAEL